MVVPVVVAVSTGVAVREPVSVSRRAVSSQRRWGVVRTWHSRIQRAVGFFIESRGGSTRTASDPSPTPCRLPFASRTRPSRSRNASGLSRPDSAAR